MIPFRYCIVASGRQKLLSHGRIWWILSLDFLLRKMPGERALDMVMHGVLETEPATVVCEPGGCLQLAYLIICILSFMLCGCRIDLIHSRGRILFAWP